MKAGPKRKTSIPATPQQNAKRKKVETPPKTKKAETGATNKPTPRKNVAKPASKKGGKPPTSRSAPKCRPPTPSSQTSSKTSKRKTPTKSKVSTQASTSQILAVSASSTESGKKAATKKCGSTLTQLSASPARSEATSSEETITSNESSCAATASDKKSFSPKRKSARRSNSNPTLETEEKRLKSLSQALEEEIEKPKVSTGGSASKPTSKVQVQVQNQPLNFLVNLGPEHLVSRLGAENEGSSINAEPECPPLTAFLSNCDLCMGPLGTGLTIQERFGNKSDLVLDYISSIGKKGFSDDCRICDHWCFFVIKKQLDVACSDKVEQKENFELQLRTQVQIQSELRTENVRFKKEIENLRSELDVSTASNFCKEQLLSKHKDDLNSQVIKLRAELENRSLTQSKLEAEVSSSRQQISRLNFELGATKQEKDKLERENINFGSERLATLTIENNELKERNANLRTQLKKTEEEMDETLKDYMTLCDENKGLSEDRKLAAFHNMLKSDVKNKRKSCQQLLQNILEKNLEFGKIFEDKKKMEAQLIAMHKDRSFKNLNQEEIRLLNEKVSKLNDEAKSLQQALEKAEMKLEAAAKDYKKKLAAQSKQHFDELASVEKSKTKLKISYQNEIAEVKAGQAKEVQQFQTRVKELASQVDKSKDSLSAVHLRLESLAQDFLETLKDLDESLSVPDRCSLPKNSSFEEKMITLENLLCHASERLQAKDDETKGLKSQLNSCVANSESQSQAQIAINKQLDDLKEERDKLSAEVKGLQVEQVKKVEQVTFLKSKLEEKLKHISDLQKEVETKRGNSENDSKVIAMLQTSHEKSKKRDQDKINELKDKLKKLEEDYSKSKAELLEKCESVQATLKHMESKLEDLDEKNKNLETKLSLKNLKISELEKADQELHKVQLQNAELCKHKKDLEANLEEEKKRYASLKSLLAKSMMKSCAARSTEHSEGATTSASSSLSANKSPKTFVAAEPNRSQAPHQNTRPDTVPPNVQELRRPSLDQSTTSTPKQQAKPTTTATATQNKKPAPSSIASRPVSQSQATTSSKVGISTAEQPAGHPLSKGADLSTSNSRAADLASYANIEALYATCVTRLDDEQKNFCEGIVEQYKEMFANVSTIKESHLRNMPMQQFQAIEAVLKQKISKEQSKLPGFEPLISLIICKTVWMTRQLLPKCVDQIIQNVKTFLDAQVPSFKTVSAPRPY